MTIIKGKFLKPDGTAISGVQVQAYLAETAVESSGPEIYASNTPVSATSDSTGMWQINLWANSNGVLDTKYTFVVTYPTGTPNKYDLAVPNQDEIFFSDLIAATNSSIKEAEIYNTEVGQYDFKIIQGTSVRKKFELLDSSNQPMNLAGWTVKMTIKDNNSSFIASITPTVSNALGLISLTMLPAFTTTLTGMSLVYEMIMYNSQDTVKLLQGSISVSPTFAVPS